MLSSVVGPAEYIMLRARLLTDLDELGGHREQLRKVQAKLRATSSKCTELAQENSLLRERTSPAAGSPPIEDALTEQAGPAAPLPCTASQ